MNALSNHVDDDDKLDGFLEEWIEQFRNELLLCCTILDFIGWLLGRSTTHGRAHGVKWNKKQVQLNFQKLGEFAKNLL